MPSRDSQSLGPTLERAKDTLKSALGEACRADIDRADTGELIRVEEVLAIANEAAKEAVTVRRRLGSERQGPDPVEGPTLPGCPEIEDESGVRWSVFEVHPAVAIGRPSVRERFRDGWLSFDSGMETRRLAPIPQNWRALTAGELLDLLKGAEPARHTGEHPASPTPPPPLAE